MIPPTDTTGMLNLLCNETCIEIDILLAKLLTEICWQNSHVLHLILNVVTLIIIFVTSDCDSHSTSPVL